MLTNYDACVPESLNKNEYREVSYLGGGSSEGGARAERA